MANKVNLYVNILLTKYIQPRRMTVYEYARADIVDVGSSVYALRTEYTGQRIYIDKPFAQSKWLQAASCMLHV